MDLSRPKWARVAFQQESDASFTAVFWWFTAPEPVVSGSGAAASSPDDPGLNLGSGGGDNSWAYEKVLVAWGPGATSDAQTAQQIEIDLHGGEPKFARLGGFKPGVSYVFKVKGGYAVDLGLGTQWSEWTAIVASCPSLENYNDHSFPLVFYSRERPIPTNTFYCNLFISPADGHRQYDISTPAHLGGWEQDWKLLVPLNLGGTKHLLLYRNDGTAFVSHTGIGWSPAQGSDGGPRDSGGWSYTLSTPVSLGNWANTWSAITQFDYAGQNFLLFYRAAVDGVSFFAPISASGDGISLGTLIKMGHWERDWTQICSVVLSGDTYLILYRANPPAGQSAGFAAKLHGPLNKIDVLRPNPIPLPAGLKAVVPITGSPGDLLLYGADGKPFVVGYGLGAGGLVLGRPVQIANGWEADWDQIVFQDML